MVRHENLQVRSILAHALQDLRLERVALLEQNREGPLRGGIERQVGVRNDLQALQRGMHKRVRASSDGPCDLHLRKRGDLGEAAEGKSQRVMIASESRARRGHKGVVQENLVND